MDTFSPQVWRTVHDLNRAKHTLLDCRECASSLHLSDELYLKKINRTFIDDVRRSTPQTTQVLQPIIIQKQNERTPRQLLTTSDVPDYLYRAIVKQSRKDQEQVLKESSKLALYSSDIPATQYDHLRMTSHGDRELVHRKLQEVADENSDLWRKMNGKWTELARRASMTKIGKTTFPGNAAQVSSNLNNDSCSLCYNR